MRKLFFLQALQSSKGLNSFSSRGQKYISRHTESRYNSGWSFERWQKGIGTKVAKTTSVGAGAPTGMRPQTPHLPCSSSSFKSAKELRNQIEKMILVTSSRINCPRMAVMITGLSSQATAIGIFILLHEFVIPEQTHCNSTGEATCKAPLYHHQPSLQIY